jgi:hypothetical protein
MLLLKNKLRMEVFREYFKMDTIAKAENVIWLWDYLSFVIWTKISILCVLEKKNEVLNTFSKLLYVAAVNKK